MKIGYSLFFWVDTMVKVSRFQTHEVITSVSSSKTTTTSLERHKDYICEHWNEADNSTLFYISVNILNKVTFFQVNVWSFDKE